VVIRNVEMFCGLRFQLKTLAPGGLIVLGILVNLGFVAYAAWRCCVMSMLVLSIKWNMEMCKGKPRIDTLAVLYIQCM